MILLILFITGWIVTFAGWWTPPPSISLIIGGGLFIFMLIELVFLRKRHRITLSAVLAFANDGTWLLGD